MSQPSRDEYLETMRGRYERRTGRLARSKLLDEFCEVTGHERKYAIKLLKGQRGPDSSGSSPPKKRGRKATYGPEVIEVLYEIWKIAEQPCGKRLASMCTIWLPHYERHRGRLSDSVREAVLAISPAQIDRVLAIKKASSGLSKSRRPPKSNAAIKALVPIRAEKWDVDHPGWLEADTVAHCGGYMSGSFIWTLTATDIYSGWTEVRPSWNRGRYNVCEAFKDIETDLPFAIKGVDTDNGGEFLNHHLYEHFTNRKTAVELSRSRPYRKNDQAHVEQKNSTHVRQLLGHDRLGYEQIVSLLTGMLEAWSVWRNCFTTSFKQIESRREGSRLIRRHEKIPLTPCDRLIAYYRANSEDSKATKLATWRDQFDPFEMKEWIEGQLSEIWQLENALRAAEEIGEDDLDGVATSLLKADLRYASIIFQKRTGSLSELLTKTINITNHPSTEEDTFAA